MDSFIIIMITAPGEEEAVRIAKHLVSEKLASCTNIIPGIRSIYTWNGKLCDEKEVLLIAKSQTKLMDKIINRVKTLHSYDVPEIIALPMVKGSEDYLHWIEESTS